MDKDKLSLDITITIGVIGVIYILFWIYLCVTYGNLPPDQVPSWVHWFMLG